MRVETNTTDRKLLANAIGEQIHEPVRYDGVPRCTYSIGPVTVERDGAITSDDADAWMTLMPFFESFGWKAQAEAQIREHLANVQAETDSRAEQEIGTADTCAIDSEAGAEIEKSEPQEQLSGAYVNIPLGDAAPGQLINLLRTLYARQKLIHAMTQSDTLFIDEELITLLHDAETDTTEKVIQLVREEISAGMVRGILFGEDKISIAFADDLTDPVRQLVYADLYFSIARRAFEAHHVSASLLEPEDTEMKYFCNSWLMQLGYGGTDRKDSRHILMDHLHGFAAFRNADMMNAHKQRLSERRHANRGETEAENRVID